MRQPQRYRDNIVVLIIIILVPVFALAAHRQQCHEISLYFGEVHACTLSLFAWLALAARAV